MMIKLPGLRTVRKTIGVSSSDIINNIEGIYFQRDNDYGCWPLQVGEITNVNVNTHTCSVAVGGKMIPEVSWASPWFACGNGAGIYTMPEEGARVLIGKFYDNQWYIFGYIPYNSKFESYGSVNGRKPIQRGDIVLSTASGNFIELRRFGEAIQIKNNANCYIILESTNNKASIRVQNFLLTADSGIMTMQSDDIGKTITSFYFKRKVDDNKNFVKLDIGSTGYKNSTLYSAGGDADTEVVFSMNLGGNARVTVDIEGNIKLYGKSITFMAETSITAECNGTIKTAATVDITHEKMSYQSMNRDTL